MPTDCLKLLHANFCNVKRKKKKNLGGYAVSVPICQTLRTKDMKTVYAKIVYYHDEWDGIRVFRFQVPELMEAMKIVETQIKAFKAKGYIVEEIQIRE